MAEQSFQLIVRKGPRPGQVFPLTLDKITLGRDPLADIVINDPEISRYHAQIEKTADGYQVQDLGSTNGAFLDGKRLEGEPAPLQPGQVLMLGSNVTMVYQAASPDDPMATMVAPGGMPAVEPEPPAVEPVTGIPKPEEVFPASEEPVEEESAVEVEPAIEPAEEAAPTFDPDQTAIDFSSPAEEDLPAEEEAGPAFGFESPPVEKAEPESAFTFESDAEPPGDAAPPPPPPPPVGLPEKEKDNRNRNIIIAVVAVLFVLCCCCLALFTFVSIPDAGFNSLPVYYLDALTTTAAALL